MLVLGIETSCDDTSIAVVEGSGKSMPRFFVRSNVVSSQIAVHRKYGGVVPALAAQEHEKNLEKTLTAALKIAKISPKKINIIAVTKGPGLLPSLLTGITFARALSYGWKITLVGVDHMEGHIVANFLNVGEMSNVKAQMPKVAFPAIALTVSGGHTQLILMKNFRKYEILGETLDDAAGEALDKVAKMLGLEYPGGPVIERLAKEGNPAAFAFPRPMIGSGDYRFSFSGLKTAVLYTVQKMSQKEKREKISDIAASVQEAIVDTLVAKTINAAKEYTARSVLVGGGVSANKTLRERMRAALADEIDKNMPVLFPPPGFSTDNGAMIAAAGYLYANKASKTLWKTLDAEPNRKITDAVL